MHIESLQLFRDLVHTGSFSETAKRNHVTQSAVSQQLRALEEKLGAQLLERTNKGVSLTPEGRIFLDAATRVGIIIEGTVRKINELRGNVSGPLRVSTVYSIGLHELPPHIKAYREAYPEVQLEIDYRKASQVYADVTEGVADLGMVAYPKARRGLVVHVYAEDKLVIICNPGNPLARRKSVALPDIRDMQFISFEPDTPTRLALDRTFKAHQIHVRRTMELDNIETVKRAVEIENGVSIVPLRSVERERETGALHVVPIEGAQLWRPLGFIRRRSRAINQAMRTFMDQVEKAEAAMREQ